MFPSDARFTTHCEYDRLFFQDATQPLPDFIYMRKRFEAKQTRRTIMKTDSTTLCVIPFFDAISATKESQEKFMSFLNGKFKTKLHNISDEWTRIHYGKTTHKHQGEGRFAPPDSRQIWLINNLFNRKEMLKKLSKKLSASTISKRTALFLGDEQAKAEALHAISTGKGKRSWMVFEGNTAPDVCIVTSHYVLVIEAKQTERKRTTTVTWGSKRDQLIRHMDAFLDNDRDVYGLFICEKSNLSQYNFEDYKERKTFEDSLPHRKDPRLIDKAVKGYLGMITWDELSTLYPEVKRQFKSQAKQCPNH